MTLDFNPPMDHLKALASLPNGPRGDYRKDLEKAGFGAAAEVWDAFPLLIDAVDERARLQELISNPQLGIKKLLVENNTIQGDFTAPPLVIMLMGEALLRMLQDAPNYTEAKIIAPATDGQRYVLRVERYFGKTPHELRRKAEEDLLVVQAALETLRGDYMTLVNEHNALKEFCNER